MLIGLQNELCYQGQSYFLQTEDYGHHGLLIESQLFLRGQLIARKVFPYGDFVDGLDGHARIVKIRALMRSCHVLIQRQLRAGLFDDLQAEKKGDPEPRREFITVEEVPVVDSLVSEALGGALESDPDEEWSSGLGSHQPPVLAEDSEFDVGEALTGRPHKASLVQPNPFAVKEGTRPMHTLREVHALRELHSPGESEADGPEESLEGNVIARWIVEHLGSRTDEIWLLVDRDEEGSIPGLIHRRDRENLGASTDEVDATARLMTLIADTGWELTSAGRGSDDARPVSTVLDREQAWVVADVGRHRLLIRCPIHYLGYVVSVMLRTHEISDFS